MRLHTGYYQSPLGTMQIEASESVLVSVKFLSEEITEKPNQSVDSDIIDKAITQLAAYFAGDLKKFELPILFTGSEFQEQVWSEVLKIDKGLISIHRSFFELGGHSLKAAVLANKINKEFNIAIPLKEIFDKPTISQQAEFIETNEWLSDKIHEFDKPEKFQVTI